MSYRFFLSYAREKTQQKDVEDFFDDLVAEVAPQLPRGEAPGFLDRDSIEPSTDWSGSILEGLRTCKVLVCVTSEAYIDSDYCGRELEAFRARIAAAGRADANLIIVVRWAPNRRKLPALIEKLQYDHRSLPDLYASKGLLRLKRQQDPGYRTVVQNIADLIVERSAADPLDDATVLPSLHDTPHPFRDPATDAPSRTVGPKNAKFVYIAANAAELRSMRSQCDAYGDEGYFWCPFRPPTEETVGKTAFAVAADMGLRPAEIAVGPDLLMHLRDASDSNTPVAIVVDPWSLGIRKYYDIGRDVDGYNSPTCAVFVPWNPDDGETTEKQEHLLSLVRRTFPARSVTSNETYYHERVSSIADLRERLRNVIQQMRFFTLTDGASPRPINNQVRLETLSVVPGVPAP
jgi:FxsC-like protein